jgi:hypothetical protein
MTIDTSWSRLIDSPIGKVAKILHTSDDRRSYHNWTHIERNFHHAKNTFNFAYDPALDLANLFHDVVYDERPDKEIRSTVMFSEIYHAMAPNYDEGINGEVIDHIVSTINHKNTRNDESMILLDLADLGNDQQCQINHGLIIQESMNLYGIDDVSCAHGGSTFMHGLVRTARDNKKLSDNPDFWDKIIAGINQTIHLNEGIIARAEITT